LHFFCRYVWQPVRVDRIRTRCYRVFPRAGTDQNPHNHPLFGIAFLSTIGSDGSDVTSRALPGYAKGIFIAMTEGGYFQYYRWEDIRWSD